MTPTGATSPVSNVLFEDIYSHDNGAFGFATSTSGAGITCRRCRLDENGALWHGGGVFIHPYRSTLTSGWTDIDGGGAGTAYSRAVLSSTDDVDVVYWINSTQFLTDIGTCGSPAVGQFCYTPGNPGVGLFYVNIGQDPNGQSIQYRRGPLTGVVIEDSSATGNIASDGTHGAGFQPDDLAGAVTIRRSYANDNAGAGFKAFRNQGTVFESVIAWGNGTDTRNSLGDQSGLHIDETTAGVVRHATLFGNGTYGYQQGTGTSTGTNVILAGNRSYGARAVVGTLTLSYADIYGNATGTTTTASGGTVNATNGLTSAPLFVGGASPDTTQEFKLLPSSALRRTGLDLNLGNIQDHNNRAFSHPPSIGAWEAASGDIATARTAASTRTAATARTAASARTAR